MPKKPPTPEPGNAPEGVLAPPEPPITAADMDAATAETLPALIEAMLARGVDPEATP